MDLNAAPMIKRLLVVLVVLGSLSLVYSKGDAKKPLLDWP